MYKALLLDLDGTTIDETETISPAVKGAIRRISRKLTVSFASSRDYIMVDKFANEIGLESLQISEGGARIFHSINKEILWFRALNFKDMKNIVKILTELRIDFMAVDGNKSINRIEEITDWEITRITAYNMSIDQENWLMKRFSNDDNVNVEKIIRTDNGSTMLDFTHFTVNKGNGATEYARIMGLDLKDIIAVGDSYNDISLLEVCGLKIAMENGVMELKHIADHIAPPARENGLATVINTVISPMLI